MMSNKKRRQRVKKICHLLKKGFKPESIARRYKLTNDYICIIARRNGIYLPPKPRIHPLGHPEYRKRNKKIIQLFNKSYMGSVDIGKIFGIRGSRVRQILKRAGIPWSYHAKKYAIIMNLFGLGLSPTEIAHKMHISRDSVYYAINKNR